MRRQRRPDRTLGVVLVGDRDPEHGEDGVADEFLRRPPEAHDLRVQKVEEIGLDAPHIFRVDLLGERGGADEIGEENGDDAPLLLLVQEGMLRRAAIRAEARVRALFGAAGGADRHVAESMPRGWA